MLDKLRANKKLMGRIEDAVLYGREAFQDLTEMESEDIVDACKHSLDQEQVAEIIANGFSDTGLDMILAEVSLAKTRLDRSDALVEVNKKLDKYYAEFFADYIHDLIRETSAEIRAENEQTYTKIGRAIHGKDQLHLIIGASI